MKIISSQKTLGDFENKIYRYNLNDVKRPCKNFNCGCNSKSVLYDFISICVIRKASYTHTESSALNRRNENNDNKKKFITTASNKNDLAIYLTLHSYKSSKYQMCHAVAYYDHT